MYSLAYRPPPPKAPSQGRLNLKAQIFQAAAQAKEEAAQAKKEAAEARKVEAAKKKEEAAQERKRKAEEREKKRQEKAKIEADKAKRREERQAKSLGKQTNDNDKQNEATETPIQANPKKRKAVETRQMPQIPVAESPKKPVSPNCVVCTEPVPMNCLQIVCNSCEEAVAHRTCDISQVSVQHVQCKRTRAHRHHPSSGKARILVTPIHS